jgi:hypothetical protein
MDHQEECQLIIRSLYRLLDSPKDDFETELYMSLMKKTQDCDDITKDLSVMRNETLLYSQHLAQRREVNPRIIRHTMFHYGYHHRSILFGAMDRRRRWETMWYSLRQK